MGRMLWLNGKLWPRDIETVLYCSYPSTYSSKRISICLIFMDPYDERSSNPDPWVSSKCWKGGFVILMPRSVSCFLVNPSHRPFENKHYTTGITLGMGPTNERRCYIVTSSLVGWPHTQHDPCTSISQISPLYWRHELEKVIDCRESGLEIMIIEATMNKKGLWIYVVGYSGLCGGSFPKRPPSVIQYRSQNLFISDPFILSHAMMYCYHDIDMCIDFVATHLYDIIDKHTPMKYKKVRQNNVPYMNSELREI